MTAPHENSLVSVFDMLIGKFMPFAEMADDEKAEIDAKSMQTLIAILRTGRHLAMVNERELGALRMEEVARSVDDVIEAELDRALGENIVSPNFGRKH